MSVIAASSPNLDLSVVVPVDGERRHRFESQLFRRLSPFPRPI
jgi:hypothetical protein